MKCARSSGDWDMGRLWRIGDGERVVSLIFK